ncbi:DUF2141 domain-containing protein [Lutibacter sp.]|uniref:DUF2141 domain-containing protein n=1 Tax=Lutibacter sp. TaxID=1925666 RepID=UPI0027357BF5|nr:DUF2141 domain-containing protein [Lutibacter sp.]MDP3312481.1 DUF2141 domain-containing protein [Lutibacter sp.]
MQHLILAIALLVSSFLFGQGVKQVDQIKNRSIEVKVLNALNDKGEIHFALFTEEGFMKEPKIAKSSQIINGLSYVTFENIPKGNYAIICFHDENGNKRMDFHENGMPKESYGTSNNTLNFGPPQFANSKFEMTDEDLTLEIKF